MHPGDVEDRPRWKACGLESCEPLPASPPPEKGHKLGFEFFEVGHAAGIVGKSRVGA